MQPTIVLGAVDEVFLPLPSRAIRPHVDQPLALSGARHRRKWTNSVANSESLPNGDGALAAGICIAPLIEYHRDVGMKHVVTEDRMESKYAKGVDRGLLDCFCDSPTVLVIDPEE